MYDADKGNILKLAGDGYILRFVCLCLMPLIFFICAFSFRSTFLCCLFCQQSIPRYKTLVREGNSRMLWKETDLAIV